MALHHSDDFSSKGWLYTKKDIFIIMNILFSNKVINAFFYQSDESSSTWIFINLMFFHQSYEFSFKWWIISTFWVLWKWWIFIKGLNFNQSDKH